MTLLIGSGRRTLLREQQTNLNVLAAFAQIADGVETGSGMAERIQRNVRASFGNLNDGFGDIGDLSSIHRHNRAQGTRQPERIVRDINCHDAGVYRVGNHNCRQPYPAAAVDCDPLPRRGLALIYGSAKGSDKPTTYAWRIRQYVDPLPVRQWR
jgi:hypothetical protein